MINVLLNKNILFFVVGISLLLAIIEAFLKTPLLIGGWHIVSYILILIPLIYLVIAKKVVNKYAKWFILMLFIMIADMFIYSNTMVQNFLPIVFYMLVFLLYLTSMHNIKELYQTFIPSFAPLEKSYKYISEITKYISEITDNLLLKNNLSIYKRLGIALAITIPFLILFTILFIGADIQFSYLINNFINSLFRIEYKNIFMLFFYFFLFLFFYFYSLTNNKKRLAKSDRKELDFLIVGVFLVSINLLFILFLSKQLAFLFSGNIPLGINIASFARRGFFELMLVMLIVVAIFLFILGKYKEDRRVKVLLTALLLQTIIMGFVSLKKMYLYQELKGATVLRYYVEWFDYFLIFSLILGVVFLFLKYSYAKLLNIITTIGILSFVLIVSVNIDAKVAKYNIEKFKDKLNGLDIDYIKSLSIDALPIVKEYNLNLDSSDVPWYIKTTNRDCNKFSNYHYGYCLILKKYGEIK